LKCARVGVESAGGKRVLLVRKGAHAVATHSGAVSVLTGAMGTDCGWATWKSIFDIGRHAGYRSGRGDEGSR